MTEVKTATLLQLQSRIEELEKEVWALKEGMLKHLNITPDTVPSKKKNNPAPAPAADIKSLLSQLDKADKKEAFKIRRQLRKAGYSLRDNNKK